MSFPNKSCKMSSAFRQKRAQSQCACGERTETQLFPVCKGGEKEEGDQFFCGKPENSTPMVLAAAVVCGVFGRRAMVFANMAGSFFSPIA